MNNSTINNLVVTEVKIRKIFDDPSSALKGLISITLNDALVIHDIRVIVTADSKRFLSMPSRKDENGIYRNVVNPLFSECRQMIEDVALDAFDRYIAAAEATELA